MTAKEKILQLIKLRISYIETYCIKHDAFMNIPVATKEVADELQQLQKLKKIVEELETDVQEKCKDVAVNYFNEQFFYGAKYVIDKLNQEL